MRLHENESFCTMKENISKMKREPTIWENIFASDTSDKGLISKIYKEFTRLQSRKTNNPIKKMGKGPEQTLLQGGHKEGAETEAYSASLAIREMQLKTTMRYHFTPLRVAIIKVSANNRCWRGCGEKGLHSEL